MEYKYILYFKTGEGKTKAITINNAREISSVIVNESMDNIISANALKFEQGNLIEKLKAVFVSRITWDITL